MSDASDRELLIRIDERTQRLYDEVIGSKDEPGLKSRVSTLERTADRAKAWWGGIATACGAVWGGLEWFFHKH